jgi:hypothetical protein
MFVQNADLSDSPPRGDRQMTEAIARSSTDVESVWQRASYVFLCLVPVLSIAIVGPRALRIPAVPWIMPSWLGVVALRRAGRARRTGDAVSNASQA